MAPAGEAPTGEAPAGDGKTRISPMATLRPGRTRACQQLSPAGSVSMTSMRPVGFSFSRRNVRRAKRRAGKTRLAQGAGSAVHNHHAALAALRWRLLRDQFFGQIEIEVGDEEIAHGQWSENWDQSVSRVSVAARRGKVASSRVPSLAS